MKEFTREQIEERYSKLSPQLKGMLESPTLVETVHGIGTKYKIHIDKLEEVYDEVGLVLLGLVHADEFIADLEKRVGGPKETIVAVAKEIDEAIFRPVRTSLLQKPEPAVEQPPPRDEHILKEAGIETVSENSTTPENHPVGEVTDWQKSRSQEELQKELLQEIERPQATVTKEKPLPPTVPVSTTTPRTVPPTNLPMKAAPEPLPSVPKGSSVRVNPPPITETAKQSVNQTPPENAIFEKKLASMVKLKSEDIQLKQTAKEGIAVAKQLDPYREPID